MLRLAGCVITDKTGAILMLHRNTPKRTQWEIPGGKIEDGETISQTAERELAEELGIKVETGELLGEHCFSEDDNEMSYCWIRAKIISGDPKIMEPQTHDSFAYFSIVELCKIENGLSENAKNFVREHRAGSFRL